MTDSHPRFFEEDSSTRSRRAQPAVSMPAENQPRLLIIGTGMMGREHIRVSHLLGRARVTAICDPVADSRERALSDCSSLGISQPTEYQDAAHACADPDIDAIIVSTPNYTHWEVAQLAMQRQLPLLIEKPMATTLEDAAAMARAAEAYPAHLQLGMQYRFKAQYVDAFHAAKHEQALGTVHTVSLAEYRPPFLDKVGQWNKFNRYSGGTLVEKCCHYFDLMNLAAGSSPARVFASGGQAVNFLDFEQDGERSDIDDHAFVTVEYENGVRGSFTLNMFCQELFEEMVIAGEKGRLVARETASFSPGTRSSASLQVEVPKHPLSEPATIGYPEQVEASGHYGATYFEHEAFLNTLEGEPADGATARQGFQAMLLASAAQHSMKTAGPVDIPGYAQDRGVADLLATDS